MYLILRVIRREASENLSVEEETHLRETFASAPGVSEVGDIMRHPRGGHMISFARDERPIEEILDHVIAAGYSAVF